MSLSSIKSVHTYPSDKRDIQTKSVHTYPEDSVPQKTVSHPSKKMKSYRPSACFSSQVQFRRIPSIFASSSNIGSFMGARFRRRMTSIRPIHRRGISFSIIANATSQPSSRTETTFVIAAASPEASPGARETASLFAYNSFCACWTRSSRLVDILEARWSCLHAFSTVVFQARSPLKVY